PSSHFSRSALPSAATLWGGAPRPPLLPTPPFRPPSAAGGFPGMQSSFAPSTFLGGGFGRPYFAAGTSHVQHHQQQQHQHHQQHRFNDRGRGFAFSRGRGRGSGRGRGGGGDRGGAAEVSPWHCCNRDFRSESELERHKSEHAKCWVADCPFTASQELIELHFVHQHRTGLANQILQADCDTWRQERRKNFPTAERAEAKRREAAAREARGEVVQQRQFGRMGGGGGGRGGGGWRGRGAGGGRGGGRGWGQHRGGRGSHQQILSSANAAEFGAADSEADARHRDPLSACLVESESDDEDPCTRNAGVDNPDGKTEMLIGDVEDPEADAPPTVLSSLAANYASSASMSADSTEADLDDSMEKEKDKQRPEGGPVESLSCGQSRRHVDAALMLHRRRERLMQEPAMRLRRPALLEMLLSRHIRHERNLLFQCVRYICSTDFLNSDAPTIDKSAAPAHRIDVEAAAETDDGKVDDAAPEFDCDDVEWEAADEEAGMATDEDGDEAGSDEASS
ncbi:hypothetical protein BOX15_Mlig033978g5, partial [Macrostomum lignano]